jgi:hypothetical protein
VVCTENEGLRQALWTLLLGIGDVDPELAAIAQ